QSGKDESDEDESGNDEDQPGKDQPNNDQSGKEKSGKETALNAQQFSAALWHLSLGYTRHSEKWTMAKNELSIRSGINALQRWPDSESGCLQLYL
ncbi:hypothetical protein FRC00_014689, partial [Tulasnella sp. 408]